VNILSSANSATSYDTYTARRSLEFLVDGASWTISTFGHFVVAWLLAWLLMREFGYIAPSLWAFALCAVVAYQSWFTQSIASLETADDKRVETLLRQFTRSALLVGLLWASVAVLLFPTEASESRLFFVFIIGGMSLAAVGTQHVYLPACYASMGIALPCLALRYAWAGEWLQAVLLGLFAAVILRLARMLSRFSMQTIRLQFERDTLLAELTARATELDAARLDAEAANVAKSRFLAQASHDLRQPLHAIGLFVETIADHPVDDKVASVISRVRRSLDSLSKLFESLLDVSLFDTGRIKVSLEHIRAQSLFDQLERDFSDLADKRQVTLKFQPTAAVLHSDRALLNRLLLNLVSNAIRYAPAGRVLVGVRWINPSASALEYAIEVRDSGAGIAPADQERVFEEFVRLHNTTPDPDLPGLGLGLSIVSRVAQLLNLHVELMSYSGAQAGAKTGTRFRISGLQPGDDQQVVELAEEPLSATDLLQGVQVLVIEDDSVTLDAMGELLRKWQCEVELHSALPTSNLDTPWDVLITDYELAGEQTGIAIIRTLRTRVPQLPAILVTGTASSDVATLAAEIAVPLLHKPVRPAQLRSALLHVLTLQN